MSSPKHRLFSIESEVPDSKRPRINGDAHHLGTGAREAPATEHDSEIDPATSTPSATPSTLHPGLPNLHTQSRQAIQRSIALVLQHDGFAATTPEALESFTQLVETYLDSLIKEAKKFALSSRREIPTPIDFERMLGRHNVPVASLKPHLKPPLPKAAIEPSYDNLPQASEDMLAVLPLLGPELSGKEDKDTKSYIPASFPDFPSKHTYRFTPREDVNNRDSKSVREQAARTAQQGEDALRRLVRASKIRKQKEVKSIVEKDRHGKERFRLWELGMKQFMGAEMRGQATDQLEIADHSMIVNSDTVHHRKELARLGKRNIAVTKAGGVL